MLLSLEDSFEQHKMDPSIQVTDLSRPSPSTSFPSELLVQIFILAIEELEPLDQWKRLARFSSVCRSWKKFVIETALLWRNISLNSDTPRSKTILAIRRSGETAFRLIASCDGYTDAAIAEAQLHRVETLDYTAARGMLNPGTLDAPILKRLTVTGGFQTYLGDVPLVSPRFPLKRLEALILSRITYPSCSPFFRPTLKILRLEVCPDRGSGSSLDAFLRALEDMSVLEELKIESTFTSPLPLHTILPVVNLPSLRELSIQEDALQAAVMLNHLEFPGSMVYNKAGHGTPFEAAPVGITELGGAQIIKDPFELLAAVFRKLSGHGLIGPASVLRELFVETNGGSIGKIIAANKARGTFSHVVVDTSKVLAGSLSERIFALASEDCLAEIRVVSLKSKWGFHDSQPALPWSLQSFRTSKS
ncbi:hypothetical protein EUX98_g3980 [Antrodiella citrinella]|uniref:F-box domain-containing protein n=1 Tax=Antrodiella citrinella TaxID=2447956 RepID=A0A4S4MV50_9APHY|nr:hypothetical protein EUX98_g3980 [Antrodiella citrinella]